MIWFLFSLAQDVIKERLSQIVVPEQSLSHNFTFKDKTVSLDTFTHSKIFSMTLMEL